MCTMFRSMYKVIRDYQPEDTCGSEYLKVEKGDILIDCEIFDDHCFHGKNMMSDIIGKIPKSCVEAFSSNEKDNDTKCVVNQDERRAVSQDERRAASLDDIPEGKTLTENPLLEAVDDLLDREYSECGNLIKYRECNYVEMSSGETLNDEINGSVPENPTNENSKEEVKPPRKPHRCLYDTTKMTDDGYNSGSHYSGENTDSSVPLFSKQKSSKQDEAGYEVPSVGDVSNKNMKKRAKQQKGKGRSILNILRRKSTEGRISRKDSDDDEMRDKYYHPPTDCRNSYFLPHSSFVIIRILLSFIAALGLSITVLLVSISIGGLHPVFSFTLAAITFIVVQVAPVTLTKRSMLCVICLMCPGFVSTRGKIGLILLLLAFLVLGPVLGMIDMMKLALDCHNNVMMGSSDQVYTTPSPRVQEYSSDYPLIQRRCMRSFFTVNRFCEVNYNDLQKVCQKNTLARTNLEIELCSKPLEHFCYSNDTQVAICSLKKNEKKNNSEQRVYQTHSKQNAKFTSTLRKILLYILPFLILLVIKDGFEYNRIYLSTKNKDNIYITQKLRELDYERKNRGLTDLIFPLTRIEFHTYLVRKTFTWSTLEKFSVLKWFIIYITILFVAVSLVMLENGIYAPLLHSQVDSCKILIESESEIRYRVPIYSILGILVFLIFAQSHVLRTRSTICDYFYPDMVDIRAKHLYYKILHDRHTFARHICRRIHLLSEEKRLARKISFVAKLYGVLPARLQNVCDKLSIQKCMICDSMSYHKTVECKEPSCLAHYCFECYIDAGQQCLTCKSSYNSSSSLAV